MNIREIKNKIREFKKNRNLKDINYDSLSDAAEKMGYTVIPFSAAGNEPDVEILATALGLTKQFESLRGFTYADANYRIIFINEDLSDDEKLIVIAHELGHIVLGHMTSASIFGKDVTDEYEANEFAHFLIHKKGWGGVWPVVGVTAVTLILAGVFVFLFIFNPVKNEHTEELAEAESSAAISDEGKNNTQADNERQDSITESAENNSQIYYPMSSAGVTSMQATQTTSSSNNQTTKKSENTTTAAKQSTTSGTIVFDSVEDFKASSIYTYLNDEADEILGNTPLKSKNINIMTQIKIIEIGFYVPDNMVQELVNNNQDAKDEYNSMRSYLLSKSTELQKYLLNKKCNYAVMITAYSPKIASTVLSVSDGKVYNERKW